MTREIGNLRTRLSFEKTGDSNITDLKRDLKGVRSEMNNFRSSGRDYRTSMKGMRQESDILSRRLKVQRETVAELGRRYEESRRTTGENSKQTKELAAQYNNAQAEMKKTQGQLERLNTLIRTQESRWTQLGARMETYGKKMQDMGRATSRFGRSYTMRVTAPIVAAGVAALKVGMDFEEGMSKVQAISGASGDELEQLRDQAKEMGETTRFSATEAASGMEFLAMAGFEVNEITAAMPGLLDLAASSNMDLGRAADIASNIISGFGMEAGEAGRVSDVLAKGASSANTNVEQLGGAMQVVAPIASTLGLEIEGMTAAVGLMSDAGIQGEQAGRMLRQGFLRLADPTGKAADLVEELGINVFDADGNMKEMDGVLAELEKGLKGMDAQTKAAALSTLFGAQSTAGWSALLDRGSDELAEYTEELQNSEGAAAEMAKVMQDNAKGAITEMKSALEGAGIAISEHLIPHITEGVKWVTEMVRKFSDLDDSTQKNILKWLGLTAAVGPAAIVLGHSMTALGGITRAGGRVATMLGRASGAGLIGRFGILGAAAGPVGLATVAVAGLGTVLYGLHKESKKNTEVNTELSESYHNQANELQALVDEYEELNGKSRLTTEEFGRLMDIQSELNKTQNPQLIAELNREYDALAEKSGLSKDEINKLIEANDGIIEQSPQVEKSFTKQGNAIVDSTEAVQAYINKLNEMSMIELQIERGKALEREAEIMQEQVDLREEQELIEQDIGYNLDAQLMSEEQRSARLEEIGQELEDQTLTHNEITDLQHEEAAILNAQLGTTGETLDTLGKQREEIVNKIDANEEELAKLELIEKQMVDLLLAEVDITNEKGNGLDKLDETISTLEKERAEIVKNTSSEEKKTQEYRDQIGELDEAIGRHRGIRDQIREETGYQSEQNRLLDSQNAKLKGSNRELGVVSANMGKSTKAQEGTNKKIDQGTGKAQGLNTELGKDIRKKLGINPNPSVATLNRQLGSSVSKEVRLYANSGGLSNAISSFSRPSRFYADGTDHHPGGRFIAGEEGFELGRLGNRWEMLNFGMYDRPKGYEVFTHDESKKILRSLNNMPAYANGASRSGEANRVVNQLNNQSEGSSIPVIFEIHVTSEIDGRVAGQAVERHVTEIQDRNNRRVSKFA